VKPSTSIEQKSVEPILAPHSVDEVSVSDFIERVEAQLAKGVARIVVDCSPLESVTSSHIHGLWLAHETCQSREAELELENVSEGLRRVLEVLNLTPILLKKSSASADLSPILLKKSSASADLSLEVSPTAEDIDVAISKIISHLTRSGLPEFVAFELQTVFYEIATNIRLHSGLQCHDSFGVKVELEERKLTLTITDPGVEFDPTGHDHEPDVREAGRRLQRRGFGLAIVKGLSNTLFYARTADQQNQIVITKVW
jgi:anti-sigma regulatory factor (Ser/Thr protein kinase)/anti-anti-sigma regulatory factor